MLQRAMLPSFLQIPLQTELYFMQDGAPAHYATTVRAWLDVNFENRWIGRRGPIEWPARSPDLTVADFFLWGYVNSNKQLHKEPLPNSYQLLEEILPERFNIESL